MAERTQMEAEEQHERHEPAAAPATTGAAPRFQLHKPGQGIHVRWGTVIGIGALAVAGAYYIWDRIQVFGFVEESIYLRTLVPLLVLLGAAALTYWLVGCKPSVVNFLIATEGEMKKVNWSSRKEVWGATKVVIVTVLALGFILAIVDFFFILFFAGIGVLKLDIMRELKGFAQ